MASRKADVFIYGITEKEKCRGKTWARYGGLD